MDSLASYLQSVKKIANIRLGAYKDAREVELAAEDINVYPNLDSLKEPVNVAIMEDFDKQRRLLGKKAVIEGRVLWEHTAAGEASRLGHGPKFFITPEKLKKMLGEGGKSFNSTLKPLELGRRHLFQLLYEIRNLAWELGINPFEVLSRQRMLVVVSEESGPNIIKTVKNDMYRLIPPEGLWFMVQPAFLGLSRQDGFWQFDPASPKHLHNHGFIIMQKTMDRQIFYQNEGGESSYFSQSAFLEELESYHDMVSYNIEDLDYLTGALDLDSIGLAMLLGEKGYGMMMEVIPNNPERPIKGGLCAHDPIIKKDVMIESFRLKGYKPIDIRYLNKNFNHYLDPAAVLKTINKKGLYMPPVVKDGYIYFQPVQGDVNFITKTLFFTRKNAKPINSLKSELDILSALEAMERQDKQPGFIKFVEGLTR
ncbi:MAG: hypothetical protein LBE38_02565 [Deltaproteobacteria bacterium]|nr:hypothetical protein [Deltaproteobacteria bacterium]